MCDICNDRMPTVITVISVFRKKITLQLPKEYFGGFISNSNKASASPFAASTETADRYGLLSQLTFLCS